MGGMRIYGLMAAAIALLALGFVSRRWHAIVLWLRRSQTESVVGDALEELGHVERDDDEQAMRWRVTAIGLEVEVFTEYARGTLRKETERNVTRLSLPAEVPLDLELSPMAPDPYLGEEGVDDGLPGNVLRRANPETLAVDLDERAREALVQTIGEHGAVLRAGELTWSTSGLPGPAFSEIVRGCVELTRVLEQQPWAP